MKGSDCKVETNIGEKIKLWRKNAGLSVKQVADGLGVHGINVSEKTIYGWESCRRQPDADTFIVLCKVLGVNNVFETSGEIKKSSPTYCTMPPE